MRAIPRAVWYIAVAAFIVRLLFFVAVYAELGESAFLTGDSRGYVGIAENIRAGHGISQSDSAPYIPDSRFPPLFLIAIGGSLAVFDSFLPIIGMNMLLGALIPLAVYLIAIRFSGNHSVSFVAAILSAFEPLTMIMSLLLIPHASALAVLLVSVFFFLDFLEYRSRRAAFFSGAFLALSTLIRPHGKLLFLFAIIFFLFLFLRERWRANQGPGILAPAAIFLVSFLLIVSPWAMRNFYHFGTFDLSSTGLRNVYTDFAVSVLSYKTGEGYSEVESRLEEDFARRHGITTSEIDSDPKWGSALLREGLGIIVENPKESFAVATITLASFFTQDLYMYFSQVFGLLTPGTIDFSPSVLLFREGPIELISLVWERLGPGAFVPLIGRVFWVSVFLLSIAGTVIAIRRGGKERIYALFFGFLFLYHAATSLVAAFSAHGFHRYPVNPFLFILASYTVVTFYTAWRSRPSSKPSTI